MPIPIEKNRAEKIKRQILQLQDEITGATGDVRRLLQKAMLQSIQADNGNELAMEKALVLLDAAIDRGLSSAAITNGPNLTQRIAQLLDRTPSLDHACGLLYEAADLLSEAGHSGASVALSLAESINTSENVLHWRNVSRPTRKTNPLED